VPWTKLESANIYSKRRKQGNTGSLLGQQQCIWEPLNIFIMVFSSVWLNKKKFRETHWNIFGVFGFLKESKFKKGKTKTRKTIYTGELPTSNRRTRKSFWVFFLNTTTNYTRKKKKEAGNIFVFSQSFLNTQEEGVKINLAWIIQWKSVDTDNWNEKCEHESNVSGNTYSSKLSLLA
jgi:hypothetical protein